jgi:hypothetical protein
VQRSTNPLANTAIIFVGAVLTLLSIPKVSEQLLPALYDEANSFIRIDPKPGWIPTSVVIDEDRPIGIVASGFVSTPRLTRGDKPYQVGPDGADVPEAVLPDWREVDRFKAFALLGRTDGGKPFLIGSAGEVRTRGRLEVKVNCPLWDKTLHVASATTQPHVLKGPLTELDLTHLLQVQGFFAVRTWTLGTAPARKPRLPPTAGGISAKYGGVKQTSR